MKYIITAARDYEEVIIEELKKYFFEEVRFKDIYPNFGNVRISGVHPTVYLIEAEINKKPVPQGLFPSITVISDNDQKNPEIDIPTLMEDTEVKSAEISDIKENRSAYIISDKDLQVLDGLTQDSNSVFTEGMNQNRRASLVIEIWSQNMKVKNRLYDLTLVFFIGKKRFTLKSDYDIVIDEKSVAGERSGNYNYDFGRVIYGGILRMSVDYIIAQYEVDTGLKALTGIIHTYEEVKDSD